MYSQTYFNMTNRCCVPLCNKPKGNGHTLHRFPSDPHFKKAWNSAIALYEEKCGRTWKYLEGYKICSRHFEKECYSITTSRKQLLPSSFPTVFDDYSSFTDTFTTAKRKRKTSSDSKNVSSRVSPEDFQNSISLEKEPVFTYDSNDSSTYLTSEEDEIDDSSKTEYEDESATSSYYTSRQKNKPRIIECVDYLPIRATKNTAVQVDIAKPNILKRSYPNSNKKLIRQDRIIGRLEQRLKHLHAIISQKNNVSLELAESYLKLTDAVKKNDLRALFIKEQLNAFGKKKIAYDVSIAEVCQLWYSESPTSYNYVRNLDILHLPSKNTLKSFLDCYSNNIAPSLVEIQNSPKQVDLQTDVNEITVVDDNLIRSDILEYYPVTNIMLVDNTEQPNM